MTSGKKLGKRDKTARIYLSETEIRMLKCQARKHGLSIPAYVRGLIREEGDRIEK